MSNGRPELTLPSWLRTIGAQRRGPYARALVDEHGAAGFGDLAELSERVGAWLRREGIEPGDRVVTAMEPSIPHVVVILGCLAAGVVPTPLNIRLAEPEARAFLAPLGPVAVFADETYLDLARRTGLRTVELPAVHRELPAAERLAPLVGPPGDLGAPDEEAPAIVFPTGGTTGTPKGAFHTHRSLWLWLNTCALGNPRGRDDLELYFSPFFHITLGTGLLAPLLVGGRVQIQRRFDPRLALAAIDRGASRLMGAPTMFTAMRERPEFESTARRNVTAIRFGSSPAGGDFVEGLLRDFPAAKVRAGFGATELGSVMGMQHEDLAAGRTAGVGLPLPGAWVRILDPDGREVEIGEVGDLFVRCAWQAGGYYGCPEETAATFRPEGVQIGDLASREEDGWVHIVGRKKEMIISGGENVFPREVEEVLGRHPAVREVLVYGMPDEHWGERVEAAVVPAEAGGPGLEELREFARAGLAGYKLPKSMRLVEALPLTANNKPDRRAVQAAALAEISGERS